MPQLTAPELTTISTTASKYGATADQVAATNFKGGCVRVRKGNVTFEVDWFDPTLNRDRTAAEVDALMDNLGKTLK